MYARIVKHDERIFLYVTGKSVKVFNNDIVRVNTSGVVNLMISGCSFIMLNDMTLCAFWDGYTPSSLGIASRKAHSFGAHMLFIGVIEVILPFMFRCQVLATSRLIRIELPARVLPWAFSYSLISCARLIKTLECQVARFLPVAFLPGFRAW